MKKISLQTWLGDGVVDTVASDLMDWDLYPLLDGLNLVDDMLLVTESENQTKEIKRSALKTLF